MRKPISTLAFALIVVSCSSDPGVEATAPAALVRETVDTSATSTAEDPEGPRTLAFVEEWMIAPRDDSPSSQTVPDDSSGGTGSTGAGTGTGSPVNTTPTAVPSGVPPAYSGLLGTLGIDDVLFAAPAAAPIAAAGTLPLTGLPGAVPNRRAVVVKIDNSSRARPQLGLNAADIVFEEEVEWGITRLAAVFHSHAPTVGPVRSGRTTDISFINAFGGPALAYSGANDVIDALLLRQTTVQNYSAARTSSYWRDNARRAPSNLFTNTASYFGGGSNPPAQFAYGTPTGGTPVSNVSVNYPSTSVKWSWTGAGWARTQNGSAHTTDGGAQVLAANVVVAVVPEVATGLVDSAGGSVPEYVFAGSGPVTVFAEGQRIDGTWTRPSLRSPAILVDGNGAVIELTPGRTWVELVVAGAFSAS